MYFQMSSIPESSTHLLIDVFHHSGQFAGGHHGELLGDHVVHDVGGELVEEEEAQEVLLHVVNKSFILLLFDALLDAIAQIIAEQTGIIQSRDLISVFS